MLVTVYLFQIAYYFSLLSEKKDSINPVLVGSDLALVDYLVSVFMI